MQDYGGSSFATSGNVMNKDESRWKKVSYQYDLISGKVNMVKYQHSFDSLSRMNESLKERIAYDGNGNILKYLRRQLCLRFHRQFNKRQCGRYHQHQLDSIWKD
ncbi:hypothetical protein FAM09_12960 [Niastella caeni]|uniref:RHS repeat-associated core domain-containing protein n=1 Tax=Niastella caeni TaxID=2569763 RepID=A0A4S8HXB3_9BACT|nr:hypothetical protein [Niastella caeni]THU39409.1 hypothetical protein FAM09_12960 [Niastella caeni]